MNWRVMYPVTIQDEDLRLAFLAESGVQDLVAKIVESVYKAAEYDEFLLFKYLLIKAVSHGKMYPISIGTGDDLKEAGEMFRGASNDLTFMKQSTMHLVCAQLHRVKIKLSLWTVGSMRSMTLTYLPLHSTWTKQPTQEHYI